tara:strand:+ start:648 stop:1013 length:366 start_codon:yes stop_codon:yes gene_type:complete
MFRANTTCTLQSQTGELDIFGNPVFVKPVTVPCAVVSYDLSVQKSSVRADSSGSRGRAEQLEGVARFLFRRTQKIKTGDIITKDGFTLEVIEVFPRRDVSGRLDHLEVDMKKTEPVDGDED